MTKEYWKDKFEEWAASGKSMAAFCRDEGLSYWTFQDWKKRFKDTSDSDLVKLDNKKLKQPSERTASEIVISLGNCSVKVPPHYDESHLLRLLATLRRLP